MADNVTFSSSGGTPPINTVVATDSIGGVDYQRIKGTYGEDGTATDVSETNPMPITAEHSSHAAIPWKMAVAAGLVTGWSINHKFGRIEGLTTAITPIAVGGVYQTPSTNTALEILSASANDTDGGTGAQVVTVWGTSISGGAWVTTTETVTMNGTTAVALSNSYTRIWRMRVTASGTYATSSSGSHAGVITLRESGGGATWAQIDVHDGFPVGQSQIGAVTLEEGETGYVEVKAGSADTGKSVNYTFFARENAGDVSTPFSGIMQVKESEDGISGDFSRAFPTPLGPFVGPCDIGFMAATTTGTANVSIDFSVIVQRTDL